LKIKFFVSAFKVLATLSSYSRTHPVILIVQHYHFAITVSAPPIQSVLAKISSKSSIFLSYQKLQDLLIMHSSKKNILLYTNLSLEHFQVTTSCMQKFFQLYLHGYSYMTIGPILRFTSYKTLVLQG